MTHYFYYTSMRHHGNSRGNWNFWKENIGIFESKSNKDKKYEIRLYSNAYGHQTNDDEIKNKTFKFKRLPKHWMPEFDKQ